MGAAEDRCMAMRMRKTPEELALCRRAYNYFNQIHASAIDFLLEHGTSISPAPPSNMARTWSWPISREAARLIRPSESISRWSTALVKRPPTPHPNQFLHNKVRKGDALQIAGAIRIGGCGGELYRPFLIHPWTDHMKKVWTVCRDGCLMQKEESVAGVTCSTVAYKIHKYQVKQGVASYIYHRPAHGEGTEGHQPPYLALGDYTMLEPGMAFSVEPGLFDPEHEFGVNFSDNFVIEPEGPARQMSRLPWSEDWCLVRLRATLSH